MIDKTFDHRPLGADATPSRATTAATRAAATAVA